MGMFGEIVRRKTIIFVAFLIGAASQGAANLLPVNQDASQEKFRQLVSDLGADDFDARDHATDALIQSFDQYADKIKLLSASGDSEIQIRLKHIRRIGPVYKRAKQLEAKLSRQGVKSLPRDFLYRVYPSDIRSAEKVIEEMSKLYRSYVHSTKRLSRDDLAAIYKSFIRHLAKTQPDWTKLWLYHQGVLLDLSLSLGIINEPEAAASLEGMLNNEEVLRAHTIWVMSNWRKSKATESAALRLLDTDYSSYVRKKAIFALTNLKSKAAQGRIRKLLKNEKADPHLKSVGLGYVDHVFPRDPNWVPVVIESLNAENNPWLVRRALQLVEKWKLGLWCVERLMVLADSKDNIASKRARKILKSL